MAMATTLVTFVGSVILPGSSLIINIVKYSLVVIKALKACYDLFKKFWTAAKAWGAMDEV